MRRAAAWLGSGLVLAALVLGMLRAQGAEGPSRVPGSSAGSRGPDGLAGLATLARDAGHDVLLVEQTPSGADLDPGSTVVLLDPGRLTEADAESLRELAEDGGRLVVGGELDGHGAETIAGTAVEPGGGGATAWTALAPGPELAGVSAVEAGGEASFAAAGGSLPLMGQPRAIELVATDAGQGRVLLLADASPLQNRLLASADNAALALNLLGGEGRPVVFIERVSTDDPTGVAALPRSWRWAFGGLVLAALVLVGSRLRRLGPPEAQARPLQPPRRRYVDAMAAALARTRSPGEAVTPAWAAARARLSARAGLGSDPAGAALERAGIARGLTSEEAAALGARPRTQRDAILVGRALAKLQPRRGRMRSEEVTG